MSNSSSSSSNSSSNSKRCPACHHISRLLALGLLSTECAAFAFTGPASTLQTAAAMAPQRRAALQQTPAMLAKHSSSSSSGARRRRRRSTARHSSTQERTEAETTAAAASVREQPRSARPPLVPPQLDGLDLGIPDPDLWIGTPDAWAGNMAGFDWQLEQARRALEGPAFSPFRMDYWRPPKDEPEIGSVSQWDTFYILFMNVLQRLGWPSVDRAPLASIGPYKGSFWNFLQKVRKSSDKHAPFTFDIHVHSCGKSPDQSAPAAQTHYPSFKLCGRTLRSALRQPVEISLSMNALYFVHTSYAAALPVCAGCKRQAGGSCRGPSVSDAGEVLCEVWPCLQARLWAAQLHCGERPCHGQARAQEQHRQLRQGRPRQHPGALLVQWVSSIS